MVGHLGVYSHLSLRRYRNSVSNGVKVSEGEANRNLGCSRCPQRTIVEPWAMYRKLRNLPVGITMEYVARYVLGPSVLSSSSAFILIVMSRSFLMLVFCLKRWGGLEARAGFDREAAAA
jgi:hypothetical protein